MIAPDTSHLDALHNRLVRAIERAEQAPNQKAREWHEHEVRMAYKEYRHELTFIYPPTPELPPMDDAELLAALEVTP